MNKLLLTGFTLVLLIAGTTAVLAATKDATTTTATTVEDISGPCDEAEHATDARCAASLAAPAGAVAADDDRGDDDRVAEDRGRGRDHPEDDGVLDDGAGGLGEDISGPCDEAEHLNDPECAAAAVAAPAGEVDDDNSGPSLNSGPGSVSSGSDDSFDDDFDDDGSDDDGGSDGDSSGPGGGDDD